jgi:hypothetical protein
MHRGLVARSLLLLRVATTAAIMSPGPPQARPRVVEAETSVVVLMAARVASNGAATPARTGIGATPRRMNRRQPLSRRLNRHRRYHRRLRLRRRQLWPPNRRSPAERPALRPAAGYPGASEDRPAITGMVIAPKGEWVAGQVGRPNFFPAPHTLYPADDVAGVHSRVKTMPVTADDVAVTVGVASICRRRRRESRAAPTLPLQSCLNR